LGSGGIVCSNYQQSACQYVTACMWDATGGICRSR
jgi:hypothetical protein